MFIDLSRVRVTGPLAPFAAGFAERLIQQGYRPSQARRHLWQLNRLSRWIEREEISAGSLEADDVSRFLQYRRKVGQSTLVSPRAMRPVLAFLSELGVVATMDAQALASSPIDHLLEQYKTFLLKERGVRSITTNRYAEIARTFLQSRLQSDGFDLDLLRLTTKEVIAYVVSTCPDQSRGSAKLTVTVLRSLLGFLHIDGVIDGSLALAVPSASGRRLVGLPKGLEPNQVQRLLDACDLEAASGRRDFAVLTMLVRLGLRAIEAARLRLDDIDWRAGEIVVHGKGNRIDRLPLPTDIGEAIAAYLQRDRPPTAIGRTVFVRIDPPHSALTTGAVTQIVERAARRCGLGRVHAHRLRHTAATAMLRAGASLPEIGQLLRHRHPITTAIYAKVDREALRTIARPWPGAVE